MESLYLSINYCLIYKFYGFLLCFLFKLFYHNHSFNKLKIGWIDSTCNIFLGTKYDTVFRPMGWWVCCWTSYGRMIYLLRIHQLQTVGMLVWALVLCTLLYCIIRCTLVCMALIKWAIVPSDKTWKQYIQYCISRNFSEDIILS